MSIHLSISLRDIDEDIIIDQRRVVPSGLDLDSYTHKNSRHCILSRVPTHICICISFVSLFAGAASLSAARNRQPASSGRDISLT